MTNDEERSARMASAGRDHITANLTVEGDFNGQFAQGSQIQQERKAHGFKPEVTEQDLAEFRARLEELRAMVEAQAPADERAAAIARVDELEQAVTAEKPRVSTMEYVRDWFVDNVPKLAGAVTSVIVSPIVGKLVQAGGDLASAELRRRFAFSGEA
jgi:hypothetical protein